MADLSISSNSSVADQAYDLAKQNESNQVHKSGKNVVGTGQNLPVPGALAASATAGTEAVDGLGSVAQGNALKSSVTNSDAPSLPDPVGAAASASRTMSVVKGSEVFASGGDGVFAALEAMSDARQKDINSAMLVKRLQGADQVTAKKQEMLDKQDQIRGDQKAADVKLMGSMVGLSLTGYLSFSGARGERASTNETKPSASTPPLKPTDASAPSNGTKPNEDAKNKDQQELQNTAHNSASLDPAVPASAEKSLKKSDEKKASDKQAWGATKRNVGMNASGTVDAAVNMLDMNIGGQAQSNAAQVNQKLDAVQGQIYQNNTDSAGAWLDNAKDQRKSAQQAIMTHVQMWGDATNNVWK